MSYPSLPNVRPGCYTLIQWFWAPSNIQPLALIVWSKGIKRSLRAVECSMVPECMKDFRPSTQNVINLNYDF